MPTFLTDFWKNVSEAGISFALTNREKKSVVLLNRAWLILMTIQSLCLVSHILHGLQRSAFMTAFYVAGLSTVHIFMRIGRINTAKIVAILVINFNTALMAVFLGPQTHVIDFLLLTALMPLYLFEVNHRKLIFLGIAFSVIPFAAYYFALPYLNEYALPLSTQVSIYGTTPWVEGFCLTTLLYLIYHKNSIYEKDVNEKELELIEQKKLYERILEQIPIDIATFDKELKFTYANSSAVADPAVRKTVIGQSNTEFAQKHKLEERFATERDRILREALEKETLVEMEETAIDRHGKVKHFLKGVSPIYNDNKEEVACLVGYSLDITGIKEAEQKLKEYAIELQRKNDDMHHFIDATSHDLKSPLRSIASYLQLLERKNAGKLDEESLSMIAYTVKCVKHLNQLISDIYQYSVADQHDRPAERTDLNNILEDSLKQIDLVIAEKKAEVRHSPLPVLKVAPAHINMLFTNLVVNAVKYNTSANPYVMISCQTTEDEYIFSVADNGIGIAPEYRQQIFEIFKRLHNSGEYEGTGVGLAICSKIADNYGGRIWVESEPGQGSAFYFSLSRDAVDPDRHEMKLTSFDKLAIAS